MKLRAIWAIVEGADDWPPVTRVANTTPTNELVDAWMTWISNNLPEAKWESFVENDLPMAVQMFYVPKVGATAPAKTTPQAAPQQQFDAKGNELPMPGEDVAPSWYTAMPGKPFYTVDKRTGLRRIVRQTQR